MQLSHIGSPTLNRVITERGVQVSQFCVYLLCADAAWVAYGLYRKQNRWKWIVLYWVILTLKNYCDIMGW